MVFVNARKRDWYFQSTRPDMNLESLAGCSSSDLKVDNIFSDFLNTSQKLVELQCSDSRANPVINPDIFSLFRQA